MAKTIVIDAGHGGADPGACGNGLQEKDINLKMAKKIGPMLTASGFIVSYTRTTDVYVTLSSRATQANNSKADLFISLHCNAAESTAATGIETLVYSNTGDNNKIASLIQEGLIRESGLTNRGIKSRPDLTVLNSTSMTAVLIELGFISNLSDAGKLKDDAFLADCASAVSQAVRDYFGVTVTAAASASVASVDTTADSASVASVDTAAAAVPDWQKAAFQKAIDSGRIKSPEYWESRLGETPTIGELFAVIANI